MFEKHLSPFRALEQVRVASGREGRTLRAWNRLLLEVGCGESCAAECSWVVTGGVSQAGRVCRPATAEQAESPKHPCEPREINTHTKPTHVCTGSGFSDYCPDQRGRASELPIWALLAVLTLLSCGKRGNVFMLL